MQHADIFTLRHKDARKFRQVELIILTQKSYNLEKNNLFGLNETADRSQ